MCGSSGSGHQVYIGTLQAWLEGWRRKPASGVQTVGWRDCMEASEDRSGLRAKGEEAVGELAQALLENPVFSSALGRALGAGERAMSAQRTAMGALNVASVSDIERLEQRLRSVSARLEAIEDRLDQVGDQLAALSQRLGAASGSVSGSDA